MNPWPVAHTLLNGQRFKVYEAELCEGNGNPGEVIGLSKKSCWSLQEKVLSLKVVQPAGKPKNVHHRLFEWRGSSIEIRRSLWKLNK